MGPIVSAVIATSSTALSNLAYLIGAVILAFAGGMFVWLRNRKPETEEDHMASFRKWLDALAPEDKSLVRPQPSGLEQFKVRPTSRPADSAAASTDVQDPALSEAAGEPRGDQRG